MFVDGPGDNDGPVYLPDHMGRERTCRASDFYGNVAPDLETLAENSGARDYQACGHAETFRKPDGCGACRYETWLRDARTRARHCEQAQAGYYYCQATPDDPCGPGPYPHDGHNGSCATR